MNWIQLEVCETGMGFISTTQYVHTLKMMFHIDDDAILKYVISELHITMSNKTCFKITIDFISIAFVCT